MNRDTGQGRTLAVDVCAIANDDVTPVTVFTVGHSTRPIDAFVHLDVTYPSAGFGTDEITSARMGNGRPVKEKHA